MSRPEPRGDSLGSIDLYPDDLDSVAKKFATGQTRLDTIATTLNGALQNAAGMAGDDSYGKKFGGKYDPAAKALFHTFSAAGRAIGQAASGLVTTANNYLKADHHSNPKHGKSAPALYPPALVFLDVSYPDPDSAIGPGHSSVPSVLAKYWPNGHQDKLRDAATAYRTASTALHTLGHSLHQQVMALTDNNSDDSVHAMADFWAKIWQDGTNAKKAPLSAAREACDKLAAACDKFAHAIDEAHSSTEHRLSGAGIAIGLTSAAGALLTLFTGGGSDAGAAALDGAEATAILGSVEVTLDAAVTDISADMIADVETYLQAAADGVPEIETVDAETTEVSQTLDRELARTEAREPAGVGGRGGSGGGRSGSGGRGGSPEEPGGGEDSPGDGGATPTGNWQSDFDGLPKGDNSHVRLASSREELRHLFDKWTDGSKELPPRGPKVPEVRKLDDGTVIQWRLGSKSGGETVDIVKPGTKPFKVHLK
ncbi:hypothetical protein [Streptomyces sp. NRRL F-5126]|uniref:WXG100-like domain-containing protein n=1 Tax=Streptomyces sp. NRRL F-5126 TaxID=1463857 RepID=UPI00068FC31F|nr:hypothetical protein [Streptomyces sp. NRRL F-5126]